MLIGARVDLSAVISRFISLCSIACCALVLISFGLFAYDEASGASHNQLAELTGQTTAPVGVSRSLDRKQPRRFIDGAFRALTSPVRSLLSTNSLWAVELACTLGALLVYGVGLGFAARYLRL
jgi:hypothetical protein